MLHELILALNGFSGEIFKFNGSQFEIVIPKDLKIPFLHPSEFSIITSILEIAGDYIHLQDFITARLKIGHPSDLGNFLDDNRAKSSGSIGSFTSSLCYGLRIVLRKYSEEIANLEWKILNDPLMTLTFIRSTCEPYRSFFRVLTSFIDRLKNEPSSCLFLDVLKIIYDGNLHHQDELLPLVNRLHITMYKQMTDWVVFGSLPNSEEFFIQLAKDELVEGLDSSNFSRSRTRLLPKKKMDKYFINYTLVPSHFSPGLVERILFMGTAVLILEKSEKTKDAVFEMQKEFLGKMKLVPLNTFRTDVLSEIIEDLTTIIGRSLHHLVLTDANLKGHLSIIKDFFLGGRGELLHEFITVILESSSTKSSARDLRLLSRESRLDFKECFNRAARRIQVQEEVLQKIEVLTISDSTKTDLIGKHLSEISLNLKLEWPLHILFSVESLDAYNDLFRFLLQVRRVQIELKTIWVETKSIFRIPILNGPALLRINMSYVVNNLQHYLQEDVLESQFGLLMDSIEKSETYDHVRVALAKFQSKITVQSFRNNIGLREGIDQLLTTCENFCRHMKLLIDDYHENGIPVCEGPSCEMNEFTRDFQRRVEFLYRSFRRLAGDPIFGCYLGQLLLRMDYNNYFSRNSNFEETISLDGSS